MAPLDPTLLLLSRADKLPTCQPVKPPFLMPIVFGTYIAQVMMGIIFVQADCYRRRYFRSDSWWIKGPVLVLVGLNVCLLGLDMSRKVKMFGLGFGDLRKLGAYHERREDISAGTFSIVITAIAQVFLIGRSFVFSQAIDGPYKQNRRVAFVIVKTVIALLAFSAGCAMQWEFNKFTNFFQFSAVNKFYLLGVARYPLYKIIWLLLSMVTDLLICCSLSLDLQRAKTGNKSSNSLLKNMIFNSLRNGFLIFVLQALALLLYFFSSASWTDLGSLVLPRLLTITCLSSIISPRDDARTQQHQQQQQQAAAARAPPPRFIRHPSLPLPRHPRPTGPSGSEKTPTRQSPSRESSKSTLAAAYDSSPRSKRLQGGSGSILSFAASLKGTRKRAGGGSRSAGINRHIAVETTSHVSVQENVVDPSSVKLGNSISIAGPSSPFQPSNPRAAHPRSYRRPRTRTRTASSGSARKEEMDLEFIESLPSGQVSSISTGTWDPEMSLMKEGYTLAEIEMEMGVEEELEGAEERELREGEDEVTPTPAAGRS